MSRTTLQFPALALLIAMVTFVVYGSFVPFAFDWMDRSGLSRQLRVSFATGWRPVSFIDWATNIAIFVPIGFFGFSTLEAGGKQPPARIILHVMVVLGGCAMLSAGIELMQFFFPPRETTVRDVMANTTGATLGIMLWFASGRRTVDIYLALARLHLHPYPSLARRCWSKE